MEIHAGWWKSIKAESNVEVSRMLLHIFSSLSQLLSPLINFGASHINGKINGSSCELDTNRWQFDSFGKLKLLRVEN